MTRPRATSWLGIDLGTSSVKVLLVADDGRTLASAREPLALDTPEPLAAEQDAHAWWDATVRAIRTVLADAEGARPGGIGLTGQKHALLALDADARPLASARLWADGRARAACRALALRVPDLLARTGAPALPGYLVPKWHDLRERHPGIATRTRALCFAKDWLRLRLTDVHATDRTEAATAQVYDGARRTWSPARAALLDLPIALLPPVFRSTAVTGGVTVAAAAVTGLPAGTPVVAGAGDNEAAALGCGALEPGVAAVILGTSGTVIAAADRRPRRIRGLVWGAHATARGGALTGTVLAAGRAFDWWREVAYPVGTSPGEAAREAEAVDGAGLPLFLPSLAGERSPEPDAEAAGAFEGLRPHHRRAHLTRAVLDGVAAALGEVVDAIAAAGHGVAELRLTSGGAASVEREFALAAAAGRPARVAGRGEGAALGAALLAASHGAPDEALRARATAWACPGPIRVPTPVEIERFAVTKARLARLRRARRTRGRAE